MMDTVFKDRISAVRRFNRFFTRQIGVLREGLLHSPCNIGDLHMGYRSWIRRNRG